ncbi:MAG: CUB domain-containing protein, partial [Bacteroidia bacterium]
MKKTLTLLFLFSIFCFAKLHATLLVDPAGAGGFELGAGFGLNGWTVVNGAANQWYVGTFAKCTGANGAYIGTSNANNNYTVNNAQVNHFYRDITVPAGESVITLNFDWHANGDAGNNDFIRVYVVTTATTPVSGSQVGTGAVTTQLEGLTGCNNQNVTLSPTLAGTTFRLIFSWRNNGNSGTNPAGMIDNVSVVSANPPVPGCSVLTSPANGATGICNGQPLTWNAPLTGGTPTGYKLFFGTNNLPTNIVNGTNIGNVLSYYPGQLLNNTTYFWYIVPTNGTGNAVGCSGTVFSFTTGTNCFYSSPGSYTNCGGTFYDSGGPAIDYSDNEANTTTICPSTPGQYVSANFTAFQLESCCDFLSIYNGNTTSAPLIGTYTGTTAPCNVVSTAANGCVTFQFSSDGSITYLGWAATLACVAVPPPPPAGSVCSTAPTITLPYSLSGETTACYGNNYTNASTGSCGTLYESGEDHVYSLTVAGPQCISISLTNVSSSNIGYQVYSGCPGSVGATCIGNNGGNSPLSGSVVLPAAGTYFIVVDSWSTPSNVNYDIAVSSLGTGPANDLPCNATGLALATNLTGNNSCSSNASEPAAPGCWTAGAYNTVWYRVTCPASGQLTIRTTTGTLSNTQIGLYSGVCGGLVLVACNINAPACGSSSYNNSQITATGLTSGASYWIAVDGTGSLTGTFDVMAVDGTVGFPPAAGQDCGTPNPVCAQTLTIGNPGYQAFGNVCDFPGAGICLSSGERGSAWYTIPISAAGNLEFDIVPNDYTGGNGCCSTDYDFAIWKTTGAGSTTCAGIAAGAIPTRCNYSGLGVTGCFSAANGNSPAGYPGYGGAYMSRIPVVAGEVYTLVVSNFSNSTSGFTLTFSGVSPVNYTAAGSSITWSGGTNTSWALPSNWGGCSVPACGIDATITPASSNQPILTAGNYYVNNITINSGASLTLLAGANLHVCGNFVNSGSLL